MAYEQNLFASASLTNFTLTGSKFTGRFSARAMPPVNSARIVYAATAGLQIVRCRVRTHWRKLPEWLSL